MDVPQLKLLAGRLRGLLEQQDKPVAHGQALDLIAALPGLRNWPEVNAFPDRVLACTLDLAATGRLAHRLKNRLQLEVDPKTLLDALSPPAAPSAPRPSNAPQIWPGGPAPGVYVTTSQEAIDALLARYDDESDGALVYAERAGNHWDGSIDLGDNGLWSNGMERVPSGTLVVVGPLELTQQSWGESGTRLEMACLRAQNSGHRVAVLVDTPAPEQMFRDLELLVQQTQPEGEDGHEALAGVVTEDGDLLARVPFVQEPPVAGNRQAGTSLATVDAMPANVLPLMKKALAQRSVGLVALGSTVLEEHRAIDLVVAMLKLTEAMGPAVRIKARNRGTPAKDMMVPDAVKVLPTLPSIQSAYAQGYRRIEYGDEVLFLAGVYGLSSSEVFTDACRGGGFNKCGQLLTKTIAALGVGRIETKDGVVSVSDMFVPSEAPLPPEAEFEQVQDHIRARRLLRWEDEVGPLLDAKRVTVATLKKTLRREHSLEEFLKSRAGQVGRETVKASG